MTGGLFTLPSSLETGRRVWGPCCFHRPAVSYRQDEATPAPAAGSLTREIRCALLPKWETHWVRGGGGARSLCSPSTPYGSSIGVGLQSRPPELGGAQPP